MTTAFDRGYLALLYLLQRRNTELSEAMSPDRAKRCQDLLQGLSSPDREVRARWLARCLTEVVSDLEARELR